MVDKKKSLKATKNLFQLAFGCTQCQKANPNTHQIVNKLGSTANACPNTLSQKWKTSFKTIKFPESISVEK